MAKKTDPIDDDQSIDKSSMKSGGKGPPSAEYVGALQNDLEMRFSERNSLLDHIEKVRFRKHDVRIPKEFEIISDRIRVPMVEDLLERVTADVTANQPRISIPPAGISDKALEASSELERGLNSMFSTLDKANRPYRVWPQIMSHAVWAGWAFPKLVYRPDLYRPYHQAVKKDPSGDYHRMQLDLGLPFGWLAPDPRSVFPLYEDGVLIEVIERSWRPKVRVQKKYGGEIDAKGVYSGPFELSYPCQGDVVGADVEFVEHWDSQWVSYFANGQLLKQIKHGYGRVPYFPFFGITTGSSDPALAAQSVAGRLIGLVEALDRLLTMFFNWAHLGSYPMAVWQRPADGVIPTGPDGKPADPAKWAPGTIQQLYPGEDLRWVNPPDVGPALNGMLQLLFTLCKEYGLPPIGKGMGQGDSAGYAINQMLTQIKAIYNPIVQNAATSLEDQCAFMLYLIKKKARHDIYMWGDTGGTRKVIKISPDMIKSYSVDVNIVPEMPQNRIAVAQASLQQVTSGMISAYRHRTEALGIGDPEQEEKRVLLERVKQSPQYQDLLIQKVIEMGELAPKEGNEAAAQAFMAGAEGLPQEPPIGGDPMAMGGIPGAPGPTAGLPMDPMGGQVSGLPGMPGPVDYAQPGSVPAPGMEGY